MKLPSKLEELRLSIEDICLELILTNLVTLESIGIIDHIRFVIKRAVFELPIGPTRLGH